MPKTHLALYLLAALSVSSPALAQTAPEPWRNTALDADARADLMIHEMTLDEKIQLVHGTGGIGHARQGAGLPPGHNQGAGFVPGIPRLHLPDVNLADSAVGVRMGALQSRYSTLLPSVLGLAASWDASAAFQYGSVIGRELRDQGFNMSIGGGVDLIREPRNGRNFEYASEDPILSGIIVGELARGVQANRVMGDIKHFVLNDQETGRGTLNAILDRRALRETDLLAFQIAIARADPAAVMCAYNRVDGEYSCENDYLLNLVLKRDFAFKGWVLSDWGGTHSTVKAALAGLDQEQSDDKYFGPALKQAVLAGEVPQARLDDMVHRIVRGMIANGIVDDPPVRRVVDPFRGRDDAQKIAEESIVLLQNKRGLLPLSRTVPRKILVVGGHADAGVLSGGGSAQVDAPGGNALDHAARTADDQPVYFPSSPLRFLRELAPAGSTVTFDAGNDSRRAATAAAAADITVVFVEQWMREARDAASLSLPGQQDELVAAVAAATPNVVVVLETGGPVTMPWAGSVACILEAWYPGIGGGQAIANILFGVVDPSGKLPVTFAAADADLPHPAVTGLAEKARDFDVDYNLEGLTPGYRWFQVRNKRPLFPFGAGLSYTSFAYTDLRLSADRKTASFTLKNTGSRAGAEVSQLYVTLPAAAGEPFRKLAGWSRTGLAPGESRTIQIALDPLYLSIFSTAHEGWEQPAGEYLIEVGGSSSILPLHATFSR